MRYTCKVGFCVLFVMGFVCCGEEVSVQEPVDYRAHLEHAFEVMATQTMEYEKSVGMSLGKRRVKTIVSQLRNEDGTVCRKEEDLWEDGRFSRSAMPYGVFYSDLYFTAEGVTSVFLTREGAWGIRGREGIPRGKVLPGEGVSGIEGDMHGVPCWIIRVDRVDVSEKTPAVAEYAVEQSAHLVLRERLFDANGRMMMVVERRKFNLSPEFSSDHFQLPKLDCLRFAKGRDEFMKLYQETVKECVDSIVGEQTIDTQSVGSWLARRWRAICRNPGRAAFWGLLVASCLCLGTAGVLRRRR